MTVRRYIRLAFRLLGVWMVPLWAVGNWVVENPKPWQDAKYLYGWPFSPEVKGDRA